MKQQQTCNASRGKVRTNQPSQELNQEIKSMSSQGSANPSHPSLQKETLLRNIDM